MGKARKVWPWLAQAQRKPRLGLAKSLVNQNVEHNRRIVTSALDLRSTFAERASEVIREWLGQVGERRPVVRPQVSFNGHSW